MTDMIAETRKVVYTFCRKLAVRLLRARQPKLALKLFLEPLNYWRNIEVPAVVNNLLIKPTDRVLDVGSPKIASLFLWYSYNCTVYSTDLYNYFFSDYTILAKTLECQSSRESFIVETQDAKRLSYPDEFFEKIYSISVIEHISGDGDKLAMQEFCRVLKKNGIYCLTVPYSQKYNETYTSKSSYYIKTERNKPAFYERHYDEASLEERILSASNLVPSDIQFFGEPSFKYNNFYDNLPYSGKLLLAPFSPLATRLFISKLDKRYSSTAIITLRK